LGELEDHAVLPGEPGRISDYRAEQQGANDAAEQSSLILTLLPSGSQERRFPGYLSCPRPSVPSYQVKTPADFVLKPSTFLIDLAPNVERLQNVTAPWQGIRLPLGSINGVPGEIRQ